MKKLNLLLVILIGLLIFSSCSNDDDSNSSSNSIIGTWKTVKEVEVCSTGNVETYVLHSCAQNGRTTYFENGTLSITGYHLNNGNCEQYLNMIGTWSLNNNNLTETTEFDTFNPTFFELSNDILRIGYYVYDTDPDLTCDGENLLSHYYLEYVRVD